MKRADGSVLLQQCDVANTALSRMIGLLGRASLNAGEGILIRPCNSVQTFFMRFPIDVIFLSRQNIVVDCVTELKPWRITMPRFSATSVLEVSAGLVKTLGIRKGDAIVMGKVK